MIYFLALIPATMLVIAGYFVFFLSWRSEGAMRSFGRYLGFWAFTLAGLVILAALFAAAQGPHRGLGMRRGGMYGRWNGGERFYGPPPMFGPRGAPPMGPPPVGARGEATPPAIATPPAPAAGGTTPRSQ
jgi:hypothetical protein